MITPTVRVIKEQNPNIPILFCTTSNYGHGALFDLLKFNPYIDKVIKVTDLENYIFQKMYNFNTGLEIMVETDPSHPTGNRIDIFADLVNIELENKDTIYTVTPSEKVWVNKWLDKNVPQDRRTLICMQIKTMSAKRNWPEEKFLLLAFTITNTWKDTSVIFFYDGFLNKPLSPFPNIHYIVGMPIRQVAALMNYSETVVVLDSGLLHLAGALKKKGVAIFGSLKPESRIKYYKNMVPVYLDFSCSPCWYQQCDKNFGCMSDISVESVFNKFCEVIDRRPKDRNKTLIYRMGGAGDLIMLSPSLRELKKLFPESKVTLATRPDNVGVLEGLPYIDDVIAIKDVNPEDAADSRIIDLRWKVECPEVSGTLSTNLYKTVNRVEMFARLIGVKLTDTTCDVYLDQEKVKWMKVAIGYSEEDRYLGIQATTTSNTRTILPEYIPEIIDKFKDFTIVLFGRTEFWHGRKVEVDMKSIEGSNIINSIDKTPDIGDMIALISLMDYVISPDSAAIHIAGALKKPCLALFGNMPPPIRIDQYSTVFPLYPKGELPCIPCYDFKNPCVYYEQTTIKQQPVGSECMKLLTPDRVFNKAKEVFKL
jgi:ADP-heptose:LPS heptosyltransferase